MPYLGGLISTDSPLALTLVSWQALVMWHAHQRWCTTRERPRSSSGAHVSSDAFDVVCVIFASEIAQSMAIPELTPQHTARPDVFPIAGAKQSFLLRRVIFLFLDCRATRARRLWLTCCVCRPSAGDEECREPAYVQMFHIPLVNINIGQLSPIIQFSARVWKNTRFRSRRTQKQQFARIPHALSGPLRDVLRPSRCRLPMFWAEQNILEWRAKADLSE
jgi:hypothetical protein